MNSIPTPNNKIKSCARVLIGSPVNQNPSILKEFLFSLERLIKAKIEVDYFFIDDNESEASSQLLNQFSQNFKNVTLRKSNCLENYDRNQITHFWTESLIWKVANFKNLIIEKAIQENYEYLFLIDSDIMQLYILKLAWN